MFILASTVCKSLQCLISALTQGVKVVTYLGSLVQLCCGEGGTLQINITGTCGECPQCTDHAGFAPSSPHVCFPGLHCSSSRLLRRGNVQNGPCFMHFRGLSCSGSGSQVVYKGTDSVGHAFCPLPRSGPLRQPGAWREHCPR